jgi:CBS domain-containing protein
MLKCSVVMTQDPQCCLPSDTVSAAAQLMREENVGSIPVIDNKTDRKLLGIVTDRDLAVQVVANFCDSRSTRVADVMTRQVITCRPDDDLQVTLEAMAKYQLRRIPVVDDGFRIVGIISQADVATRIDHPGEIAKVVKEISQPEVEPELWLNKGHQG